MSEENKGSNDQKDHVSGFWDFAWKVITYVLSSKILVSIFASVVGTLGFVVVVLVTLGQMQVSYDNGVKVHLGRVVKFLGRYRDIGMANTKIGLSKSYVNAYHTRLGTMYLFSKAVEILGI
jgi:hypothetical protein